MTMQAIKRSLTPIIIMTLVALMLVACETTPRAPDTRVPPDIDARAARMSEAGRHAEAAALYARTAERSVGAQASRLFLSAAESWWQAGDGAAARTALGRIDPAFLDRGERARGLLLEAGLAVADNQPAIALRRLDFPFALLPSGHRAQALSLRADAHVALDMPREAIADLVAREALLRNPEEILDNQQRIWSVLGRIGDAHRADDDPLLAGWLALAHLRRIALQDPMTFSGLLDDWRRRYPGHPAAASLVPRLIEQSQQVAGAIHRIALILPVTGRFGNAAEAVRDGFLAAHFRTTDLDRSPEIRIYDDAGDPVRTVELYHQAVREGADMVVGPLQREAVTALAGSGVLPVPVLALNTVETGHPVPANLFQFGLTPEDEALQIAERLVQEGLMHGITLVPDNDIGIRMLRAFTERYESLGGTVLVRQLYSPQQQDHSGAITQALAIDESEARQRILRTVLDADIQSEPRRRRDADFVFLVGTPQQGRALRPQLRFHHASDLQVYAPSLIYTGIANRAADSDLDGIAFTDIPWIIAPDAVAEEVKATLSANLGGGWERNVRLYALGFDAYRLVPVLHHRPDMLSHPVPASTGAIWLDEQRRIRRHLAWGRFSDGLVRPLR